MAEGNTQTRSNGAGNKRGPKARIHTAIDLGNLDYLQFGDLTRTGKKLKRSPVYMSQVRHGKIQNLDALAALLELGGKNKAILQKASA